jgi:hypothetical protein
MIWGLFAWIGGVFAVLFTFLFDIAVWAVDASITLFLYPTFWIISKLFNLAADLFINIVEENEFTMDQLVYSEGYATFTSFSGLMGNFIDVGWILSVGAICTGWLLLLAVGKFLVKLIPTVG